MKVAIIGPITPFRGGVAKHTTEIAREFLSDATIECRIISFSRLYPRFLFPGESDKENSAEDFPGDLIEYRIDSILPWTWMSAVRDLASWEADCVIIPAWTFFVAPCLGWISRALRRRGVSVVSVVHNASDHEPARFKQAAMGFQLGEADSFVTHNEQIAKSLKARVGDRPIRVCPHPIFSHFPEPEGALRRRSEVELLFFGLVRPYKGLDILIEAAEKLRDLDVSVSVVGEFWFGLEQTRGELQRRKLDGFFELVPRYVDDQEAAEYFARCDVVVLPYRSVSGSGVIPLAYRYERPVVVSDLPSLENAVLLGKTGWSFQSENAEDLARTIREQVRGRDVESMREAIRGMCAEMSWRRMKTCILDLVAANLASRRRAGGERQD